LGGFLKKCLKRRFRNFLIKELENLEIIIEACQPICFGCLRRYYNELFLLKRKRRCILKKLGIIEKQFIFKKF